MNYIWILILVLIAVAITKQFYFFKKYKPGTGRIVRYAVRSDKRMKTAIKEALESIGEEKNCKFSRAFLKSTYTCDDMARIIYNYYEIEYWLKKEPEKVSEMYDLFGTGGYPM